MSDDLARQLRELACISGHGELGDAADAIDRKDAALRGALEALDCSHKYIAFQNNAEGMLDGFGPRKPRQSDAHLCLANEAIAKIKEALND